MADVRLFTGLQIGPAITGNMAPHFRDARVYETLGQQRVVILQESEARNAIFLRGDVVFIQRARRDAFHQLHSIRVAQDGSGLSYTRRYSLSASGIQEDPIFLRTDRRTAIFLNTENGRDMIIGNLFHVMGPRQAEEILEVGAFHLHANPYVPKFIAHWPYWMHGGYLCLVGPRYHCGIRDLELFTGDQGKMQLVSINQVEELLPKGDRIGTLRSVLGELRISWKRRSSAVLTGNGAKGLVTRFTNLLPQFSTSMTLETLGLGWLNEEHRRPDPVAKKSGKSVRYGVKP